MKNPTSEQFGPRNLLVASFILATSFALSISPAFCDEPATNTIKIFGDVEHPMDLSAADLKSLPGTIVHTRDHDGTEATYDGPALVDIIAMAKPRFGEKPNNAIARGHLIVHAADNYQAVFSLAEISAAFTDNKVILAYQRDGKPLSASQGPYQIVVSTDKIHARWVRQVTSLEIVILNPK